MCAVGLGRTRPVGVPKAIEAHEGGGWLEPAEELAACQPLPQPLLEGWGGGAVAAALPAHVVVLGGPVVSV